MTARRSASNLALRHCFMTYSAFVVDRTRRINAFLKSELLLNIMLNIALGG